MSRKLRLGNPVVCIMHNNKIYDERMNDYTIEQYNNKTLSDMFTLYANGNYDDNNPGFRSIDRVKVHISECKFMTKFEFEKYQDEHPEYFI